MYRGTSQTEQPPSCSVSMSGPSTKHQQPKVATKKEIKRNINHVVRLVRLIIVRTYWFNVFKYLVLPGIALAAVYYYDISLQSKTFYLAAVNYNLSMLAITAGYHRYWTHRSYSIDPSYNLLPTFFAFLGSTAGLESVKNYIAIHKLHHKYCDTNKDPHNYRKNFWWAHIGWRIVKQRRIIKLLHEESLENVSLQGKAASAEGVESAESAINVNQQQQQQQHFIDDPELLANHKYIDWQDSNNLILYLMLGLALPSLIAGYFWNDYLGGFVYAGIIRSFIVQQSIFSIHSLGHSIGSQPFEDKKTVRDSFIVSLLTYGEGYNNFHHQFPNDYRGGYFYYRYDPTKWFLNLCFRFKYISGVKSLHRTNEEIIKRCAVLHQQRLIDRHRAKLTWGVPINKLPLIKVDEFKKLVKTSNRALVIIKGVVHDVTPFVHNHPGGVALIKSSIGKDATTAFNGAVYAHSNAANNLLATMRIALIRDENTNSVIRQNRTTRSTSLISSTPLETADAA